jgi:hypothetical protein
LSAELRPLRIKVSGCPNGCAQHSIANIGFYAAALSKADRSVPAYFVTVGGETSPEGAQFGSLVGKFPAKNCVQLTETVLALYQKESLPAEQFTPFANRIGTKRLKEILDPLRYVPSFEEDPSFYEDYGHEHESFAVRRGIKGECAGSTVAETLPTIEAALEGLAQTEALLYHKEYEHAALAAYESAAAAARVPLYERLVDPFTAEEALWEFENMFVLSGQTGGEWDDVSLRFEQLRNAVLFGVRGLDAALAVGGLTPTLRDDQADTYSGLVAKDQKRRQAAALQIHPTPEDAARAILEEARKFVSYCALPIGRESGVAA